MYRTEGSLWPRLYNSRAKQSGAKTAATATHHADNDPHIHRSRREPSVRVSIVARIAGYQDCRTIRSVIVTETR